MQAYAGTAAPFNFNGLVRHYYMRQSPELGDLQINLADKAERERSSHAIALDLRQRLAQRCTLPEGSTLQVVEVPPGPPVLATLLAEIYGPDAQTRRAVAEEVRSLFKSVPYIVDVTNFYGHPRPRLRISIDQDELEYFGVEQSDVYDTIQALFGGVPVGYSHRGEERDPIAIRIGLPKRDLSWDARLASTPVPANTLPGNKTVVELGQVVRAQTEFGTPVLFRRDGHFADMVMGELAGAYRSADLWHAGGGQGDRARTTGAICRSPISACVASPTDESHPTLLWDGEWEITYVTFRDMGAAFAVAMLGIYILVVAQFRSFKLPLVILTPIPLTLIGIVPGHWLFHAPFTATSMIGFIALAGIIVRNSILLVDFVRHGQTAGRSLRDGTAGCGRDPLQADPVDGAIGDDRRGDDLDRSDLPGPGNIPAVRPGVIDPADRARDTGHLCRAAGCGEHGSLMPTGETVTHVRRPIRHADAGRHPRLCPRRLHVPPPSALKALYIKAVRPRQRLRRLLFPASLFHQAAQIVIAQCPGYQVGADQESRCPLQAERGGVQRHVAKRVLQFAGALGHVAIQPSHVHTGACRCIAHLCRIQAAWHGEQRSVHRREASLPVRRQRHAGRRHRHGAQNRPVHCDEANVVIFLEQLTDHRMHSAAIGAAVVVELRDCQAAGRVAQHRRVRVGEQTRIWLATGRGVRDAL